MTRTHTTRYPHNDWLDTSYRVRVTCWTVALFAVLVLWAAL